MKRNVLIAEKSSKEDISRCAECIKKDEIIVDIK